MLAHSRWLIKKDSSTTVLLDQFRQKFTLEPMQSRHETLTFFDDFEWHLWHKKKLLAGNNAGSVFWVDASQLHIYEGEPSPVFARDFRHPELQQTLLKDTKGRRLFPMAELEVEFSHYAIRNSDLKKVCDLHVILTGYGTMIELRALRGYEKAYRQCLNLILHNQPDELEHHIFHNSLSLLGIQPSGYQARPRFRLAPELESGDAVGLIAQKLWHNVRANEEGIIRDWDTSFLHQYRVALRRMRALFTQMKQSLNPEESQWFREHLGELARSSNQLRDLDVYLAAEETYLGLIPENFHAALKQLFRELGRERQKAQKQLTQKLKSADYRNEVAVVESHLALCPQSPPAKGHKAIQKQAARQISRRYQRIITDILALTPDSPDDDIHKVRLGCKKLRYLLEFFAELFPKEQTRPVLKALKQLQDNLGAFNDFSVQRHWLENHLAQQSITAESAAAVHALNGVLFNSQMQEKTRIRHQLSAFMSDEVRQSVDHLLTASATTGKFTA